jgi:hypothetical protein
MFCNLKQRFTTVLALVLVSAIGSGQASQTNGPKQLRRAETFAVKDGPEISVEMESPAETDTRLQVLYFFEYREGEKNPDANQELDRKLRGVIQELRQSGKFAARPLETLTLVPPPYSIRPRQLLLIGLGKPEELSLDLIKSAGRVGMREALRLGVRQYAQTFDWRDDKTSTLGVGAIARNLIEGAICAYATEKELQERGLAEAQHMSRITLLTAPATYKETVQGVKNAISNLPQSASR